MEELEAGLTGSASSQSPPADFTPEASECDSDEPAPTLWTDSYLSDGEEEEYYARCEQAVEQYARSADKQRHAGDLHRLYFPSLYEYGIVPVAGPVPGLNNEGMGCGDHNGRMGAEGAGEPILPHGYYVVDDLPDLEDQSVASADLEVEVLQPQEETRS